MGNSQNDQAAIQDLIEFENSCSTIYAAVEQRDWGCIYFNRHNPLSWDSNHAVISPQADPIVAAAEIIAFFQYLNITPRIYLMGMHMENIGHSLDNAGFLAIDQDRHYLLCRSPNRIRVDSSLNFQRIAAMSPDYEQFVLSADDGIWTLGTLRLALSKPDFYLFGAYFQRELVAIGSLHTNQMIARIDHIFTKKNRRRRGYSSQMINHLCEYTTKNLGVPLYLWTDNPEAQSLYHKAGFVELPGIYFRNYWYRLVDQEPVLEQQRLAILDYFKKNQLSLSDWDIEALRHRMYQQIEHANPKEDSQP